MYLEHRHSIKEKAVSLRKNIKLKTVLENSHLPNGFERQAGGKKLHWK